MLYANQEVNICSKWHHTYVFEESKMHFKNKIK